jgi:6-pyruvoyl-tetrahydropterin synthase
MSVYEASAEAGFRAGHAVRAPDGSMEAAHEHDWRVTATFRAGTLNANGFVVDFLAVRSALERATGELAGRDLNAAIGPPGTGASAERVAEHLAGRLAELLDRRPHCVRVVEAPGCTAAFYPEGSA